MLLVLITGMPVILCNMLLQSWVSIGCIRFYIKRFHHQEGVMTGVLALFGIIIIVLVGNLLQIMLWGVLFLWLGSLLPCKRPFITLASTLPPWVMVTS